MSDAAGGDRLKRDLRAMTSDGVAFSVMVGAGETYVPAFALALGMGSVTAGLVATLPMLVGSVVQLVTPLGVRRLDSHRRWVVGCAALQAASFVPLVVAAALGTLPELVLYATASLYWAFGMATSPAWNTWVGTLLPRRLRARYLASRNRWSQAALLAGLVGGGVLLEAAARADRTLVGFAALFAVALVARAFSARFLARQSEPRPIPLGDTRVSLPAFVGHLRAGGHGRLLGFLLAFQLAVWVAAPFFTPYMLERLELSYAEFTALTGAALGARVVALPFLGRLAHRRGTWVLLSSGALGIVPLPVLWLVSDAFAWLFALQLAAGVAWAAFELATLLSFFEYIPESSRTTVLSMYNLANALAVAVGALLGTLLLRAFDGSGGAFAVLFFASSAARTLALPLLRGAPDSAAPSEAPPLRTLGVRPSAGAIQQPVLAALEEEPDDGAPERPA